jgi:AcrR family transcriptional regulator
MPKQTFFNLPDEKREQIVQIAIDEFAENDYDNVSISRIVARAGIAKGSFYQYFDGKEDLYGYLIGLIGEAKTRYLSLDHPDPQHIGIFAYMRWLAEFGLGFELAHPKLTRVGVRALSAGGFPTVIDAQIHEATMAYYRRLVEVGQQQGDIAPDLDPGLAAVIFEGVLTNVGRFIVERAMEKQPADGRTFLDDPQVQTLFASAMGILEHGMAAHTADAPVASVRGDE